MVFVGSAGHQLDAHLAQIQRLQQRELFVEAIVQVFGALAIVLLAAARTRHTDHQVFIEVVAEAHGGGAHAARGPIGALLLDLGLRAQAVVGLSVGKQQRARKRS